MMCLDLIFFMGRNSSNSTNQRPYVFFLLKMSSFSNFKLKHAFSIFEKSFPLIELWLINFSSFHRTSAGAEESSAKAEKEKGVESENRSSDVPPSLPPASSPGGAGYMHPYHYPGPYPHPPPIMYPPTPSSYHPYYGGYPGGPPYHMHPPPGMVVPQHPGSPMGK